jgi:hypothetical protein
MPDELHREEQAVPEDRLQHVNVLSRGNAPEQHYVACPSQSPCQPLGVALEWQPVPRFASIGTVAKRFRSLSVTFAAGDHSPSVAVMR